MTIKENAKIREYAKEDSELEKEYLELHLEGIQTSFIDAYGLAKKVKLDTNKGIISKYASICNAERINVDELIELKYFTLEGIEKDLKSIEDEYLFLFGEDIPTKISN